MLNCSSHLDTFQKSKMMREKIVWRLFCVTVGVLATVGLSRQEVNNLLTNPSFEDPIKGSWKVSGFQMTQYSEDKVHGNYAALCSQRKSENSGPSMALPTLKKGGRYAFEGRVKVLQDKPGVIWQNVKVMMMFHATTDAAATAIKVPENATQMPTTTLITTASANNSPKPTKKPQKRMSCKGLKGEAKKECRQKKKAEKQKQREANLEKKSEKRRKGEGRQRMKREQKAGKAKGKKSGKVDGKKAGKAKSKNQERSGTSGTGKSASSSSGDDESSFGNEGDPFTYIIAYRGFVRSEQGWITIAGNLNAPMKDFTGTRFAIRGPAAGVDFLLDNLTLWEVPEHPDWETQARINIDKYRKSDMQFRIHLPRSVPAGEVEIQIDHKKHKFAFGSKVEDDFITGTGPVDQAYQKLFYYLFNWATVGSWKWRFGRPFDGQKSNEPVYLDYSRADEATDVLRQMGIKVRGHAILWGHSKNNLGSVVKLNSTQLKEAVKKRVNYIVEMARGKLAHWDVANEFINGHYFEEVTQDANISIDAFKMTRQLDPVPKRYLNDFQCVTTGAQTEDYRDLGMRFLAAGTGIEGLGVQGHTKDYTKPDPTMIWKRLDRLAETGLEIFMTEFDLPWDDVYERADWLEDAFRAFFAHPRLSGVILWGFWQERMEYKNMYLVQGDNLKFVEPGERVACLVKKEWSTHVTKNLDVSGLNFNMRGFQGDYDVIVKRSGVPIHKQTFYLDTTDSLVVTVDVPESRVPIDWTSAPDLVPQCVSHRGNRSLGVVSSTYTNSSVDIACESRYSDSSDTADGRSAGVTCQKGWVMTGCSSYTDEANSARTGETIVVEGGVPRCIALNGTDGTTGKVYAVAKCCQGLTCDYQVAGPSHAFAGARAEARCGAGFSPFGCSAYSPSGDLDGVFPDAERKSCVAQSGEPTSSDPSKVSGVSVIAACCRAPNNTWSTVSSVPTFSTAEVSSDTTTVFSQNGKQTNGPTVSGGNRRVHMNQYRLCGIYSIPFVMYATWKLLFK